jgi:hypothetical protein
MATGDPTNPAPTSVDPNEVNNLNSVAFAATQAKTAFSAFGSATSEVKNILGGFYDGLKKIGVDLTINQRLTEGQSAAFGVLATSVLGARKAFDNLNGVDTSRINTFTKQWTDLQAILNNSPGAKTAAGATQLLVDALIKGKAPMDQIKTAMAEGVAGLNKYAASFFEGADNASRLQETIASLAARTGGLNEVFRAAGPNLSNLNQLTENYQKAINDANSATHVGVDIMEQYYAQISAIPGAMQATVKSATDSTKNVSLLTAATQYSIGAHRDMKDVVEDLRTAFRDYNITGDEALQFTARMTEINNKFGVELSDVRGALMSTAENFKMFGNEAEGAARMMNQYLGALESTGISGAVALDVVKGMTEGIKGMSIAQKSFLSAQTGGAGGLMGGFQIEKLMRDGKMDEVMAKVKTTLTRQMGPLVSVDEAANDPAAAARLVKQRAMLMQGPLGKFAGDEQSASRIIEGMKNQQSGKSILTDLATKPGEKGGTQDLMKQGINWQEKTHTVLSDIRDDIRATQGLAGISNLTTAQRSMTAGVGAHIRTGDFAGPLRRDLSRGSEMSGVASGQTTDDLASALKTGRLSPRQTTGRGVAELLSEYKRLGKELPEAAMAPINNIKSMLSKGNTSGAADAYKESIARLDAQKAALKNVPASSRGAEASQIADQKSFLQASMQDMMGGAAALGTPEMQGASDESSTTGDRAMDAINSIKDLPGLGDAASAVAGRKGTTATGAPQGMPLHPHPTETDAAGKSLGEITVHIEGHCLDCGEKIRSRSQGYAVAPQTKMK